MKKQAPMTVSDIKLVIKDILKALCFLKTKGIIHCDLKPENILFADLMSKGVKLIDFGGATFINDVDYSYLQSRPYRAPELIFGCEFDFQADMWSLGCIIYELLSCKKLFRYKTIEENLAKALAINKRCSFLEFSYGKNWSGIMEQGKYLKTKAISKEEKNPMNVELILPDESWNFQKELNELKCDKYLRDFIIGCLKINPTERLTPEMGLKHPVCY